MSMLAGIQNRTREFLYDIFVHDAAEKVRIGRAAQAIGYGLDPEQYARPFPGTSTNNTVNIEQKTNGWGKAILAGLVAAGLGGASLGVLGLATGLIDMSGTPKTPNAPVVQPPDVTMDDVDLRIRWWVEDGEGKSNVEEITDGPP